MQNQIFFVGAIIKYANPTNEKFAKMVGRVKQITTKRVLIEWFYDDGGLTDWANPNKLKLAY